MAFRWANGIESWENMSEITFLRANGSKNQENNPELAPVAPKRPSRATWQGKSQFRSPELALLGYLGGKATPPDTKTSHLGVPQQDLAEEGPQQT